MRIGKELSDFVGRWHFDREVCHADGSKMQVIGSATMDWQDDALIYLERGTMKLPLGRPISTERRYLWQPGLRVHFEDGSFFHIVPPLGGQATHWCPPDDYHVEYDFEHWPKWQSIWRVNGPAKAYKMTTVFTPDAS